MSKLIQRRALDALTKDIRSEIEAAEADWESAVQHAINAGRLLLDVKRQLRHGEWTEWLKANFPRDHTTASDYMRVARRAEQIGGAPSIRSALQQLAPPPRKPTPAPDAKKAQAVSVSGNGSGPPSASAEPGDVYADLNDDQIDKLRDAAQPLWCALAELGWVDAYGGAQFRRVLPAAIDFIHQEANAVHPSPSEDL